MADLIKQLSDAAVDLLIRLIKTPSYSREETDTATMIQAFLEAHNARAQRQKNNVWAVSKHFDAAKPTILLNSHHDTVKPGDGWKYDPFGATLEGDKLIGLGSNDAGASVVSLLESEAYCPNSVKLTLALWVSLLE